MNQLNDSIIGLRHKNYEYFFKIFVCFTKHIRTIIFNQWTGTLQRLLKIIELYFKNELKCN